MAKGNAFIGVVSGKLGSSVGFKISNPATKEVQGWRPYQSKVNNPKTELQAIQRMKMAPAQNFYRQLSTILDNAWQGQRYGELSRRFFMSQAMTQVTGIPFIVKGDKLFYPGEYPVAQGSLVRQSVTAISGNLLTTSLVSPGITGTWGEVSQGLINKNFGIQDGDKLTFIFVGTTALGEYLPAYSYVILDTTNDTPAADILASSNLSFAGAADAQLQVGVVNAVSDIVAGAVILSRLDTSSGTKWLRSNSVMFCSEDYKEVLMGSAAYQASVVSYMANDNVNSDWYLNAGITGTYNYVGPGGNSGSNLTVVSSDNITASIGETPARYAVALMSDGSKRAYRSNTTPSYLMYLEDGDLKVRGASTYLANAENLAILQEVDNLITGYISANPTSGGTVVEEP